MNILQKSYYFFSNFADPDERLAAKFFASLSENHTKDDIKDSLDWFVQHNIIALNLWSEYKYRGYKYLNKSKRRELYSNARLIAQDFAEYSAKTNHSFEQVLSEIMNQGVNDARLANYSQQLLYIRNIMSYLSPHRGRYNYRASSTFGALLKDPKKDVLVGDCNQIVTLYIYLYSQKFDVNDLQIKTCPGHVSLHFKGVDIEATSGTFANYQQKDQAVLPIEEIVSVNILDVTDEYFKTHDVSAESLLESARIAYILSSERELVKKNLAGAYNNVVVELTNASKFDKALKYAKQSENAELLNLVGHNGALSSLEDNDFSKAIKFAFYAKDKIKLNHMIYHNQGVYYMGRKDYHKAIRAFSKNNENDAIKDCYASLFAIEQKKLGNIKTEQDIKKKRNVIANMSGYARKSGNNALIKYVDGLKKYL